MLSAPFRAAVENGNIEQVPELLHEDVVFRSPVLLKPDEGRGRGLKVLCAAEPGLTPREPAPEAGRVGAGGVECPLELRPLLAVRVGLALLAWQVAPGGHLDLSRARSVRPDQIAPLRAEDLPVAPVHETGERTVGAGSLVMADDRPRLQQDTVTAGEDRDAEIDVDVIQRIEALVGASDLIPRPSAD